MKGEETMKKALSLALTFVILASVFGFVTTEASSNTLISTYEDAKNGDLLYELKFGETTGVYTPTIFMAQRPADAVLEKAVVISDNGRTLAFYKPGIESGAFRYGGEIDGLTWGENKTYTITMKLMLPATRGGVYFNFPADAKKEELKGTDATNLDNKYSSVMYGIYGRFDEYGDLGAMKDGSRIAGRYRFDTTGYKEFDPIIVEGGTFLDVTFLVEDYSYSVFVNDYFLDVIDLSEDDVKGISDNLGFSVYLYHFKENTPMIVKDVNIYKGDTVSAKADYPTYARPYYIYVAPETTTAAPTTPKETTKAPDTTPTPAVTTKAPATTTKAPATTTAAPKAEGGCGSAVASGLALISLVSLAGVITAKKRR